MRTLSFLLLSAFMLSALSGCGGPQPVRGGTPGIVHVVDHEPLADVRVVVHRMLDGRPESIGFGVTQPDGTFVLYEEEAVGPLWLEAGEYRFTLESMGTSTYYWPREYDDPEHTPLQKSWMSADRQLVLEIPLPRIVG